MTREEAISHLIDLAGRWAENAEESLPARISPEMLVNDQLFEQWVSEIDDPFDQEDARNVRDYMRAMEVLKGE